MKHLHLLPLLSLLVAWPSLARAATYYVATTGSDTNDGSESAPFASWAKAQTAAAPGDTVYFRGGRYVYEDATATCGGSTSATVNAVVLDKSGTKDKPINYFAYPGERPIFDFSGITDTSKYNCRQAGVRVTGSWLHLKGLELTGALQLNDLNHESWCVYVYGGSNDVFELLDAHHNMGPGFFVQRGSNNTFLNCDSHENEDTLTSNGDGQSADGFGCHPNRAGDTGNVFRGCRAWWNTDDGWDFINAQEACTVESSWAFFNGYKPDAVSNGQGVSLSSGNGNGFKGGGYGLPPSDVPSTVPQHVIRLNLAAANKAAGFYANHSPNSPVFYDNTAFKNAPNYNLLGVGSDGSSSISVGLLRNNLAFSGTATSNADLDGPIDSRSNSWDAMLTVASSDFESTAFTPPASCPAAYTPGGTVCVAGTDTTSFAGLASAREADGSLPRLPFMRLAANSKLIDAGVDVGLPYVGTAPDLGAFEYGATEPMNGGSAGAANASGGAPPASGGAGAATNGGRASSGGRANGGAANAAGATSAQGGRNALGGASNAEGGNASGGLTALGGAGPLGAGGSNGGVGTGGVGTGGAATSGGTTSAGPPASADDSSGCGCRLGTTRQPAASGALGLALVAWAFQRRRSAGRGSRSA